jgi:hypothetical protein
MEDLDVKQHLIKNRDGTITMGTSQNYESILRQNVYEANHDVNRVSGKDVFGRKVASIPLEVINSWCKEWGITMHQLNADPDCKAKMMARLRDRSYLKLRTDSGRI